MTIRVEVPRKLKPLLKPCRYKGAYGGRGGAKSHFFAEQLIIRCFSSPTRAVCIREVQNSIRDSVRQLLIDKIEKFGLQDQFDVLEAEIRGRNGSLITFRGMQSYNAANIKSLEGFDVAWVEEAQTLSKHSLELLRPTIRKEGSELWFSWNPRHKTDPVDAFFRKRPPNDAICVAVNWMDNPWFPEVLRQEMLHDFEIDEDNAEHVWNGAYGASQGAILAKWVNRAERDGRIHDGIEPDLFGAPIQVSCDIGYRDTTSFWYWQQKIGGFSLLTYEGDICQDVDDWIPRIKAKLNSLGPVRLGKIWLPHDAKAQTFRSKHTVVEQFLEAFGAGKIDVVPQSKKQDQINAARTVIERCEFHSTNCEAGLDGLRAWEFEYNEELQVLSRAPLHNWASHPSDAFAYGCQVMLEQMPAPKEQDKVIRGISVGQTNVTLNEMWAEVPRVNHRI